MVAGVRGLGKPIRMSSSLICKCFAVFRMCCIIRLLISMMRMAALTFGWSEDSGTGSVQQTCAEGTLHQ